MNRSDERSERSSDPLPFLQVDRSVRHKVPLLAGAMGVSSQHAMGALVDFWGLCSDPRELEAVVRATPPDATPILVLPEATVKRRLKLATGGIEVDPDVLMELGLLEPHEKGIRVRGMSRYLAGIRRCLKLKESAKTGGQRSANARRAKKGTAQPIRGVRSGRRSESASTGASTGASSTASESASSDASGVLRTMVEASAEHRDQRSEYISTKDLTTCGGYPPPTASGLQPPPEPAPQPEPEPPVEAPKPSPQSPSARASDELCRVFQETTGSRYAWNGAKDGVALAWLLKQADLPEVLDRWRRGLQGVGWKECSTVAELRTKWNHLREHPGDIRKAPVDAKRGQGPITVKIFRGRDAL